MFARGGVVRNGNGQRAFEGKSHLSVASAILEKEPAPISLVKTTDAVNSGTIIKKCLEKLR